MCLQHQTRAQPHAQAGQVLPVFAIVVIALIAVAALVADMGFQFGQRRYDQNGSDGAALAAAQKLAVSADVRNGAGDLLFLVNDAAVEELAFQTALVNQNSQVADASDLVVALEYAPSTGAWCLSPATQTRYPAVTFATAQCILQAVTAADGTNYTVPPYPTSSDPYRVRVVVSSTIEPVFFQAMKHLVDPTNTAPEGAPAGCTRAPGAGPDDLTTCARAVAAVRGSSEFAGNGPLLPVTRGNCDLLRTGPGTIHELMGPHNAADCGFTNLNPWKNVIDFSTTVYWDDGDDYDYRWDNLIPPPDGGWNRDNENGRYKPDTTWSFNGEMAHDFLRWAAYGFRGTATPDNPDHPDHNDGSLDDRDGVKIPTYVNSSPAVGNSLGNLINDGFYCQGKGALASCSTTINPSGQYFFSQSTAADFGNPTQLPCNDPYGGLYKDAPKRVGCRDSTIAVWGNTLEWADKHGNTYIGFVNGIANAPDRLMPVRFVTMRIYCQEGNTPGVCDDAPKAIVGHAGTSGVYGRYSPDVLSTCPVGANCNLGPSVNGVWVTLEE